MADTRYAFVGTYTDGDSEGVYTCNLDRDSGELERVDATAAGENPSFLAVHPNGEFLYAVNEVDDGAVTALSIDRDSGELTELNQVVTGGGADPCYCTVEATGQYLLVAHYTGGTVAMVPIEDDGTVAEPSHVVEHEGSGPNPDRQETAHPHSIRPGPENRFAYVPDLGTDEVFVYELDLEDGKLRPTEFGALELPGGSGPRHLDFHPDQDRIYLLNELDSTLTVIDRDPSTGALDVRGSQPTLPATFEGDNTTADVHVHDSGKWVYASNRGHDSIAVFAIDETTGALAFVERVSTRGEWPRNFAITPPGSHLLAENEDTDDVVTFEIDEDEGTLSATGAVTEIPSPVCVQFL
jgi:6-phosphogluconolactonase